MGDKTGAPVFCTITPLHLVGPLLPWLALLALMFAAPNRHGRAWWLWAPLLLVQAVFAPLALALGPELGATAQCFSRLGFAVAALWLLMPYLTGKGRAAATLGAGLTILFGTVAFGLAASGLTMDVSTLISLAVVGFGAGLAFCLAVVFCRKLPIPGMFIVWLLVWTTAIWFVVALPFVAIAISEAGWVALTAFLLVPVVAGAVFMTTLAFVLLSAAEPFYRARFQAFLGFPGASPPPPVPPIIPVPETT